MVTLREVSALGVGAGSIWALFSYSGDKAVERLREIPNLPAESQTKLVELEQKFELQTKVALGITVLGIIGYIYGGRK